MSTTKIIIVGTNSEVRKVMKALVMGNPEGVKIADIKGCAVIAKEMESPMPATIDDLKLSEGLR